MKYNLEVHGCHTNISDGERVATVFEELNFEPVNDFAQSDCVVFVSCSIKQKAEDKIIGHMKKLWKLKRQNPSLKVGLTGCMVRKTSVRGDDEEDAWIKKLKALDFVFKIDDLGQLPDQLRKMYGDRVKSEERGVKSKERGVKSEERVSRRGVSLSARLSVSEKSDSDLVTLRNSVDEYDELVQEFDPKRSDYFHVRPKSSSPFQGKLTIMTGCNKFCTYCIVPYSRGRERSRPMWEVIEEAKILVEQGMTELLLVGQNVNSYGLTNDVFGKGYEGSKRSAFAQLLRHLNDIDGVKRIRFTSPHPRDMTEEVIDCVAELPNLCEWLHMPLQSGNDEILKRMNRGYTFDVFYKQIEYMKKKMPRMGLTTDLIVGFCGETEQQHRDTLKAMERCGFDIAYISQYSSRRETYADKRFEDTVSHRDKKRRYHEANVVLRRTSQASNDLYLGEEWEVLVDQVASKISADPYYKKKSVSEGDLSTDDDSPLWAHGKLRTYRSVKFPVSSGQSMKVGDYVKVKMTKALEWILEGEMV
jgi:tRNA-2-methylthio-N6-dimethylallyladenosine synthase